MFLAGKFVQLFQKYLIIKFYIDSFFHVVIHTVTPMWTVSLSRSLHFISFATRSKANSRWWRTSWGCSIWVNNLLNCIRSTSFVCHIMVEFRVFLWKRLRSIPANIPFTRNSIKNRAKSCSNDTISIALSSMSDASLLAWGVSTTSLWGATK